MEKTIPELRTLDLPLSGGLNETMDVSKIPLPDALIMTNYRQTVEGTRIVKRAGFADLYTSATFTAVDIYGFHAYWDSTPSYCMLALAEDKIWRKVGSGAWTAIHTFSSSIVHPQKVLEIQGKQFIINEKDSRMIHTDGNDYQIGITAPATLPTLTAASGGSFTAGDYRYAVTYARGGNYGCESNPIKSLVGAVSFTGTGVNDMTAGTTFTGRVDRTVRVKITTTGTPDKIDVSFDGGSTWYLKGVSVTSTVYLPLGLTLLFATTTGHTLNDYWQFTCDASVVTVTANQLVNITTLPVSSDAQVTQRKIYRTVINGTRFYYLTTINDNTSTTFTDNIPDSMLGSLMEEDRDLMPNGKFACWWDNRLWVSGDNIIYYSEINTPEEFDLDARYILFRQSESGDEITGIIPFKDNIYVFKKNSISIIQKLPGSGYARYLVCTDIGCIAPFSLVEVNNLLMFLSPRGWEVFNGADTYSNDFSVKVYRTYTDIDKTKTDYISCAHDRYHKEVWLSLPDLSTMTACILVYNYASNNFYKFTHATAQSISCVAETRDGNKKYKIYICTRDGYIQDGDSGEKDGTSSVITATIRKPWVDANQYADVRSIETVYELPTSKNLTVNVYVNYDKDVFRTDNLEGATPSATDITYRKPITTYTELGLRAKYFCLEYINAEDLGAGGEHRLNGVQVKYRPRYSKRREIKGD